MGSNDTILSPGQRIRPTVTLDMVSTLLDQLYGFKVINVQELNAYDDRNYHVLCEENHKNPHINAIEKHGYVLKIVNSLDSKKSDVMEAQNSMLIYLNERGVVCPQPVKNLKGTYYSLEKLIDSKSSHVVKLLVYRPGELLHRVPLTNELLYQVGHFVAKLDKTLVNFDHPAYDHHRTLWMLIAVPKLREFVFAVKDEFHKSLANEVINVFEEQVLNAIVDLEEGIIHGDLNEQNIVMNSNGIDIAAVIDFGDSQKTCLIFELAITLCYMILEAGDVGLGKYVIEGYQSIRKLSDLEKKVLKTTVCARICQSLVMGAYSHLHDPQNDYLLTTQKSGWTLLKKLWPMSEDEVWHAWGLLNI